jgi:Penicillin amidase
VSLLARGAGRRQGGAMECTGERRRFRPRLGKRARRPRLAVSAAAALALALAGPPTEHLHGAARRWPRQSRRRRRLGQGRDRADAVPKGPEPAPYGTNDANGFRNILRPGQNGHASAADLAAFGAGRRPPHNDDQLGLYEKLVFEASTIAPRRLRHFYKDATSGVRPGDTDKRYSPREDVTILRDKQFGVPHVYGKTRRGTMFGAGYAGAEDRLFLMDVLRHAGRAELRRGRQLLVRLGPPLEALDDRIRPRISGGGTMTLAELVDAMEDAGTIDLRGDKVLLHARGARPQGEQAGHGDREVARVGERGGAPPRPLERLRRGPRQLPLPAP